MPRVPVIGCTFAATGTLRAFASRERGRYNLARANFSVELECNTVIIVSKQKHSSIRNFFRNRKKIEFFYEFFKINDKDSRTDNANAVAI